MKPIRIAVVASVLLLVTSELSANNSREARPLFVSHGMMFKAGDKISASVGVIQAFAAIRDKNAGALIHALSTHPSPVNESFTLLIDGEELRLRLIHIAALSDNPVIMGILINAGARASAKDSLGRTAAHYASFGAPDLNGYITHTPIVDGMTAAFILEMLYAEGVNMNGTDKLLRAPLHYAAKSGDPTVINKLLSFGVISDPVDSYGFTPKQLAVRSGFLSFIPGILSGAGAVSRPSKTDYIIGAQNDITSFVYNHPIITTGVAAFTGIVYVLSLPSKFLKAILPKNPPPQHASRHDGSSPPPDFGLPKAHMVFDGGGVGGGGGGSGMPVVMPLLASTVVAQTPVEAAESPRPSSAASSSVSSEPDKSGSKTTSSSASSTAEAKAPLKTVEKTNTQKLRDAIHALNEARDDQDSKAAMVEVNIAETLLAEARDLGPEGLEQRRHLIGALGSIAKHKKLSQPVVNKAQSLVDKYKKR